MITSTTDISRFKLKTMGDQTIGKFSFPVFLKVLSQHRTVIYLYVLGAVLACLIVAVFGSFIFRTRYYHWVQALEILVFIRLGIHNAITLPKRLPFVDARGPAERLVFCFLLCFLIYILLAIYYAITFPELMKMALAGSSAFLLPAVVRETFLVLEAIPEKTYTPWYISDENEDTISIYLNSLQVELHLALKYYDISNAVYQLTMPGQTPFGILFNRFITSQNRLRPRSIELTDDKNRPYGWEFYVTGLRGMQKRHVDPNLSLRDNGIKEHTKIIAKRISNKQQP